MKLQLRAQADDAAVTALLRKHARAEDMKIQVHDSATVLKPNGDPLLVYLKGGISDAAANEAYPFLHSLRTHTSRNRGTYSGLPVKKMKLDGTVSKTTQTEPVRSTIVGYMNRYPRFPACNRLPLLDRKPDGWASLQPMIREASALLKRELPKRWKAQSEYAQRCRPEYVIPEMPFTTLTVNNTIAGAYHTDKGDYKPGFGVMAVFRRGSYKGCELVLPKFGVGVDLQDRDLILFDVHEVHGNRPLFDGIGPETKPEEGGHERISVVFYFREKMIDCLEPAEELKFAQRFSGGSLSVRTGDEDDDPDPADEALEG